MSAIARPTPSQTEDSLFDHRLEVFGSGRNKHTKESNVALSNRVWVSGPGQGGNGVYKRSVSIVELANGMGQGLEPGLKLGRGGRVGGCGRAGGRGLSGGWAG